MEQLTLIKEKGNLRLNGITGSQILQLLEQKHSKDVFVSECKNGETLGARDLMKLDAWVLPRTYSPLTTIGYEIKVSRQDFEQDQKWSRYLDLCHQFYFVCPAGLIRAIDLPQQIGLIWVSSSQKLHTKRKAERITPDIAKMNRLLIYVLMARAKITANMYDTGEQHKDTLEILKDAIERANERKELAYFVKSHIREIEAHLKDKERELIYRENTVHDFQTQLEKLGITWNSETNNWQDNNKVRNEIDMLKRRIDRWTLQSMKESGKKLMELAEVIAKYREEDDTK